MDRLKDKVAFITGSGSGIGRTTAILFAKEGATVVVADIDESTGQETVDMITDNNGQAVFIKTDVTKEGSVKNAVLQTTDTFGKLDVIDNNAGGSLPDDRSIEEVTIEVWDKTLSINLFSTFLCSKYGIPELIKGGGGSVIMTGSTVGLVGWARSAYTAAKGGIISLTRVMAVDYAKHNIRVNCVCPGLILTERMKEELKKNPALFETIRPFHLLDFGEPKDISYAKLYLASDESKTLTGAIFPIDSAWSTLGRIDKRDLLQR